MDGDNRGHSAFFLNVKNGAPVKRAREEYEARRRKMQRTRGPGEGPEEKKEEQRRSDWSVEDVLPQSYALFAHPPQARDDQMRFVPVGEDDEGKTVYALPMITSRGLMQYVLDEFEKRQGKHQGLYFHGLQGNGKPYSLLYLVHYLRGQRDKYRVTYVHDCNDWVNKGPRAWAYIFKELLFTFALDTFPQDSLVQEMFVKLQEAGASMDPNSHEMIDYGFHRLVHTLSDWVRSKGLL